MHLPSARFVNLAVEGELAVRLGKDLPSSAVSEEECREAIAEWFPVIELHHYVLPAAWPPRQWLIASGGMHAGFVRAEPEPLHSRPVDVACRLCLRINDAVVGAVNDGVSLAGPIKSLRWLAGRLAQFNRQLCKGQVILTGSPLPLFAVAPGSRIVVEAPPLVSSCVETVR